MTVVNTLILYSLSFTILVEYINITISITHAQLHASSQHSDTHLVAFLASSCPQMHKVISHIPLVTQCCYIPHNYTIHSCMYIQWHASCSLPCYDAIPCMLHYTCLLLYVIACLMPLATNTQHQLAL